MKNSRKSSTSLSDILAMKASESKVITSPFKYSLNSTGTCSSSDEISAETFCSDMMMSLADDGMAAE